MHICVVSTMWAVILCYFLWFYTAATNDINSTKHYLRLCTLFCTNCVIYFTNVVVIILLNVEHVSISLISLWARPTTASCQTQSGFDSWGGWPLSPAANLVANTIFTSAGLKLSRHANKVPCTVWARSFLTWVGRASWAGSGRGRKYAPGDFSGSTGYGCWWWIEWKKTTWGSVISGKSGFRTGGLAVSKLQRWSIENITVFC
jgi:hypothetical protein